MFEDDRIYSRGHEIYYDKGHWRYKDSKKPVNDYRKCGECGKKPNEGTCEHCETTFIGKKTA